MRLGGSRGFGVVYEAAGIAPLNHPALGAAKRFIQVGHSIAVVGQSGGAR